MEAVFIKILNMSITASWIVLAFIVARLLLKKAPKWINVLMWGLVGIRLVCPFSLESVFSLIPSAETVPNGILYTDTPTIHSGVAVFNSVVNPIILESLAPTVGASVNPMQVITFIASIIWIMGIAVMLIYTAVSYLRIHKKVREAIPYQENIWLCDHVHTPFILGVIRPRIFLPSAMSEQDMKYVIAHEKAHLKRHDHWWKPLGFILLTIYWFHPILWIAYILLCRDIELACDEKVIRDMGTENKRLYSDALINCSVPRRMITACPLAFGEVGVKERVKTVMNYKKPAFWVVIVAVIACVVVAVCFLTNPKRDSFLIKIVVPAGIQEQFVYSDVEISPIKSQIIISSGDKLGYTEVMLKPVEVKQDNAYDEPTYLTPGMPLKWKVEKGAWFKIGVNVQNPTNEDITVYINVENVEVRISDERNTVRKWFDYFKDPDEMHWDQSLEINIPEFPDVMFRWYPDKMEAVTENEGMTLYTGMPIWNAYFCDLTGDGLPELCSSLSFGSGMIDNRIIIYDYANGASYGLEDRGTFDYTLRLNDNDGQLYVDKKNYNSNELVSSGRLMFKDNCIQIVEQLETAIYDSMVFDVDGDGKDEYCVLGYGITSGLFSFTFSASETGAEQPEYNNVFCTGWYDLSFIRCDDGVVRVQGIDQEEVPQTHLFDIAIIDGNVHLTEDGRDIGEF